MTNTIYNLTVAEQFIQHLLNSAEIQNDRYAYDLLTKVQHRLHSGGWPGPAQPSLQDGADLITEIQHADPLKQQPWVDPDTLTRTCETCHVPDTGRIPWDCLGCTNDDTSPDDAYNMTDRVGIFGNEHYE